MQVRSEQGVYLLPKNQQCTAIDQFNEAPLKHRPQRIHSAQAEDVTASDLGGVFAHQKKNRTFRMF